MKVLITIHDDDIAERFDLSAEVIITHVTKAKTHSKLRTVLLPHPSAEEVCGLILKENISLVICGGIEESHYKYLSWKKVKVIDGVIGPFPEALQLVRESSLAAGTILPGAITSPDGP